MKIPNKSPKSSSHKSKKVFWQTILSFLFLVSAFAIGYISNPGWSFDSTLQSLKALIKTDQAIVEDVRQEIGLYTSNGLATLFLDIPFDSLLTVEEKRANALASGIRLTSDEDFVPASMRLNGGESFPIKIRLKGDWTDHLVGEKWSFRIHIRDSQNAILGMSRFSIQAPETRNYEKEWIYHQNLLQEGILTPRYYFVNVVQNGKFNGMYALEASFTEDLLKSQGRREGPIIRYNEDLLWKNWENLGNGDPEIAQANSQIGEFWLTGPLDSEIIGFDKTTSLRMSFYQRNCIQPLTFSHRLFNNGLIPGEEVFDQDLWGKFFAITDLWAAGHTDIMA